MNSENGKAEPLSYKANISEDTGVFYYCPYIPLLHITVSNSGWSSTKDDANSLRVYRIISDEVLEWIESNPTHMWDYYQGEYLGKDRNFTFTEEMEMLFLLRWR